MNRDEQKPGRKRISKTAGITLATSLGLATLLAGCGNSGGSNTTDSGKVVQLTLWHAMGGAPQTALNQMIKDFNSSHSNIQVKAVYQGNYDDEFNKFKATQGSGKDGPNLMQVYDIGTKFMVDTGDIQPMQDFIDQSKYDISSLEPNILGYYSINDKLYSMPFNASEPVLYYNKDLFQKAGITSPPTTYSEVTADAKKLTQKDSSGKVSTYGIGIATYGWFFEQMVATQGGFYANNENGRADKTATEATFNGAEGLTSLNWWKSLYDAGVDLNLGSTTSNTQDAFLAGKCAMFIDSSGILGKMTSGSSGKFSVGIGAFPKPDGATGGPVIGGGSMWIMKNQSKAEQDAAWQFVQFIASPKEQAYWTEQTGYFPITKSAYDDSTMKEFLTKNPEYQHAVDQLHGSTLTHATQGGYIGVFPQARQTVQDMIQSVLLNKQTSQKALDAAAAKVTQAMQQYAQTVG
jgi:sn-glycerol 3-phosphate transport system substrate-binding protein